MKALKITLGLAVATSFLAACNNSKPDTVVTGTETAGELGAPEIVYVNSDSLLANYEYFTDVRDRLQGKATRSEQDLRAKAEAFQKEVAKYQQTGASMSQSERAATEERLAQKQQQLQALSQNAGNELAGEESEEMKKIYDRVEEYLKQLSEEKGYKMVLTYSRGNSAILYSDPSRDITETVVNALNEAYATEKGEAEKAAAEKK
ncbi:periplasmic chaperone for outer membrane proteins Skp [Pontibacter ummariensis]|uniref:Periplasmic chaperone for outer membrane proteins Skp n=1 Tax=Pontibacter ummariensis TaxID=1610492 RepID=A0A239BPL4_9BACT|nr:OmpH family outer membrane protein [Pontibacter ummariensis]PRY15710.1 periplasmic chaperone for outer membrane proteins Skp [Pontibacter ummariensis]SNS09609.1 periplasmic chaperone for outer membrane proteins Skp [Pontibacter ummariensis]